MTPVSSRVSNCSLTAAEPRSNRAARPRADEDRRAASVSRPRSTLYEEGAYVFITGRREAELAVALKEIGSDVYSQMLRKRRMSMKNAKELMLVRIFLVAMLVFASKEGLMSQTKQEQKVRNVVVVHGGFVDGSGWEGVYNAL